LNAFFSRAIKEIIRDIHTLMQNNLPNLGVQKLLGVKVFGGSKLLMGQKNFRASTFFGGHHLLVEHF
jgi:hypothetical protein